MLLIARYRILFQLPVLYLFLLGGVFSMTVNTAFCGAAQIESKQIESVIDLQPFRTVQSLSLQLPNGKPVEITLINLNSNVNQWYILRLSNGNTGKIEDYHLENPYPASQRITLDETSADYVVLTREGKVVSCPSWNLFESGELAVARKSRQVFAPLCNGNMYLRNPTKGHRTNIETVTEFLRDNLPGGESVVGFVKDTFFKDAFLEKTKARAGNEVLSKESDPDFPAPADVNSDFANQLIVPEGLGIQVDKQTKGMLTGQWYAVNDTPGIFVSLIQPKAVAPAILTGFRDVVNRLDRVESGALAYLIAFDLDRFELGFSIGTDHPRVEWSNRALDNVRIRSLPGPDGIGNISPLRANGMISPVDSAKTVASFTGGFKRTHSAFKYGQFARINRGSHYGFIESGVVLSTLQPGLATLLVFTDGTVAMKTWSEADNADLNRIVHARQNGVPILEWDATLQQAVPGNLVAKWGAGNWSGSQNMKLRTLRAGAALQKKGDKHFLIYGYFSTATPSAMARVFQAYGCSYALHLDMNALEHTYLALYLRKESTLAVQHLIQGMSVLDKSGKGSYTPRFLGYPDNRDFFYVMRRE